MSEPARIEPDQKPAEAPPVVVKKYANRRLYNTESSSYITLDNLAEMVRQGRHFVVYDAKTSEDITRSVLTQIIVEEEGKGKAMLPTAFLRQLIGFYGDSVQGLVPRYLEQALAAFGHQQEQMRTAMQKSMGNFFAFGNMEEVGRQNMAMMERALSLFTPFYRPGDPVPGADGTPAQGAGFDQTQDVAALRAEIEVLRQQLAEARAQQPAVAVAPAGKAPKG
jgi:polyhydroxyalkanoate synthesis repressor PhaR